MFRVIIARFRSFIMEFLDIRQEDRLRGAVDQMLRDLEAQAGATSLAMAQADEAYGNLQREMENHESLGRQAEQFLSAGDEPAAQRCVTLQLQSKKEVTRLTELYQLLQSDAEQSADAYRRQQYEVEARARELPQLESDARVLAARQRVQSAQRHSLEAPKNAFDEAARELRIARQAVTNRQVLDSDPNAAIDQRIRRTLADNEVDEAMNALRQRVADKSGSIDVDFTEVDLNDPVSNAQKLLEAPRFQVLELTEGPVGVKARRRIS
jgi:phage shock protein A